MSFLICDKNNENSRAIGDLAPLVISRHCAAVSHKLCGTTTIDKMATIPALGSGLSRSVRRITHRITAVPSRALSTRNFGGAYGNGEQGVDLGRGEKIKFQKGSTVDALDSDLDKYLRTVKKDMYPPSQRQKEGQEECKEGEEEEEGSRNLWLREKRSDDTSREVGTGDIGSKESEFAMPKDGGRERTPEPSSFWRPSGSE